MVKSKDPGRNKYSSKGSITNYTDMVITEYECGLSFSQQVQIQKIIEKDKYNSFIVDIVHPVTNNPRLDESSVESKKIKTYVSKLRREIFAYNFSNEDLDFIEKNHKKMRPNEIGACLFPKLEKKKFISSKQGKSLSRYIKALKIRNLKGNLKGKITLDALEDPTQVDFVGEFVPPKKIEDLVILINKCDHSAKYIPDKLTKEQRQNIESLKGYLRSPRFVITIDSSPNNTYKKVVLSEYVKTTYDKPDLTADELNAYVTLCDLYGHELEAKKQMKLLNEQVEIAIDDDDPKLKLSIVEALTAKSKELKDIHDQQDKLRKGLSGDRHKRLEKQVQLGESLILFVEKWKEEESRAQAIKIAEARNLQLKEEKKKVIETFDDYIIEVHGVYEDEILEI